MKKTEYLQIPQVAKMLTENEKKVVRANDGKPLLKAEDFEIVEVLDRAALMTGTAWSKTQNDLRRIVDFIRDMYGNLTTDDFVNAFMFLCAGEIDMYLPADRSGQPDRNSYGTFNEAYIGKVLRAYSQYCYQVYRKINYYMPRARITDIDAGNDERRKQERNRQERNKNVLNAFEAWKKSGNLGCDNFEIIFIWQALYSLGLIQGQEASVNDVVNAVMCSKKDERRINDIKTAFSEIARKKIILQNKLNEL